MRRGIRDIIFLVTAICLPALTVACSVLGFSSQPPLPTIVAVSSQSTATIVSSAVPAESQTSDEAEPQQELTAEPAATITPSTPTEEPTLVFTPSPATTPLPTEVPPTPTPIPTATPTSPPATTTPVALQPPALDAVRLKLIPVASGFTRPTFLTHAGDSTGRLFVVEQAGRILVLKDGIVDPTPFLDIVSIVGSDANEQGLFSLAFHPNYPAMGYFFVNYTNQQGDTIIARYNRSDNPAVADPNSARILMTIGQPFANHNGGQIAFGPDGYLYIGMGDGGAANDPLNHAQNLESLLGKILRIDVDQGDPYGAPQNNPFVNNAQARPEIWSYGWRNPWRFSFDSATGEMYVGDVGQNRLEEVNVELANSPGQNYGWRLMEGNLCANPNQCDPATLGLALPVTEYDRSFGCSVTGGYVYRGPMFPALEGIYFYGDYCTGILWGLRREADGSWSQAQLLTDSGNISSFGQDQAGELYLVDHAGNIFQLGN